MSAFQQPSVEPGDMVDFFHGGAVTHQEKTGSRELYNPTVAIVTAVHQQGISLALLPPDVPQVKVLDGAVRHKNDPQAKRDIENDPEMGVWDLRPGSLTAAEVRDLRVLAKIFQGDIAEYKTAPNTAVA